MGRLLPRKEETLVRFQHSAPVFEYGKTNGESAVCKTAISGFNSHPVLQFSDTWLRGLKRHTANVEYRKVSCVRIAPCPPFLEGS